MKIDGHYDPEADIAWLRPTPNAFHDVGGAQLDVGGLPVEELAAGAPGIVAVGVATVGLARARLGASRGHRRSYPPSGRQRRRP